MNDRDRLTVFFATSEVFPLVKVGGLADVSHALPSALARLGHEVSVFLPRYRTLPTGDVLAQLGVRANNVREKFELAAQGTFEGVRYYTLGFSDGRPWDPPEGYVEKDLTNYVLFSRAVADLALQPDWRADVVHCNDWHVGHVPAYLRTIDGPRPRTVLTIHNLNYQGLFEPEIASALGVTSYGAGNLLSQGITGADVVTTVSPRYRDETLTPLFGAGLHDVLAARDADYHGVLNGVDYTEFDPSTDQHLTARYDVDDLDGKARNKQHLQRTSGLPVDPEVPVFSFIARLVPQKGIDVLIESLDEIGELGAQLVVVGRGEDYEVILRRAADYHPWLAYYPDSSEATARPVYAGSDLFLAPSAYEPCGLAPLIALRYGAVPIVRETGGLIDTVADTGLGFSFARNTIRELVGAMRTAVDRYHQRAEWAELRERGMRERFSWDQAAERYVRLYRAPEVPR